MQTILDDEAVEFYPPAPLGGIHLIHKVSAESGGSLALRIHSLTKGEYDEELSASGGDFMHRYSPFDINGVKSSANPVRSIGSFFGGVNDYHLTHEMDLLQQRIDQENLHNRNNKLISRGISLSIILAFKFWLLWKLCRRHCAKSSEVPITVSVIPAPDKDPLIPA